MSKLLRDERIALQSLAAWSYAIPTRAVANALDLAECDAAMRLLKRLEKREMVASKWGGPGCYRMWLITPAGRKALEASHG